MCQCCCTGCKDEFKCSNFLLTHPQPELFVKSQWISGGCTSIFYLAYRFIVAVGFIIMVLKTGLESSDGVRWFTYLTNWSFMILTIDTIMQLVLSILAYSKYKKTGRIWEKTFQSMPWCLKIEWVITNTGTPAAWLVSASYWFLIYHGQAIEINNFNVHGMNSIYVFINLWITAMPVRIYHVYHVWIMALTYTIFSAIYQLGGDQPALYALLDWENPGLAVAGGLVQALGGTTVVWLIYYALYRLRLLIHSCVVDDDATPEEANTSNESIEKGISNPAYIEHRF